MKFPLDGAFSRRHFLWSAGGMVASAALSRANSIIGANHQVRLGLIGCGGRGTSLAQHFKGLKDVKFVAVCDPDTAHMDHLAAVLVDSNPDKIRDYRKLLERADIDAVIIASPNHWHALHTIHACQAGKDVYVEKPVSHDIWSGRQMVNAVARYQRVVQAGTQNRSDIGLIQAFAEIQRGAFGKITAVHGLCMKNRESIGKLDAPLQIPATLDYDLWLGPAKDEPLYRPQVHYDWHWDYNTGNGDIGNQGPHEFDMIQWVLGDSGMPKQVRSFGGRYGWDDAGCTANMQAAFFEINGVPVTFEVNNMRLSPARNVPAVFKDIRVGIIVTCEQGEFRGGRGGGFVVAPDGKTKLAKFPGDAGVGHAQNFIDAVRSRRVEDLRAPIKNAHQSSILPHLANISLRAGEAMSLESLECIVADQPTLLDLVQRQNLQLRDWQLDLQKTSCAYGPAVSFDAQTEKVTGPEKSFPFVRPEFRKGYEVPEISYKG